MLIKNTSTNTLSSVENYNGVFISVLPGQVISATDDRGIALINQGIGFESVSFSAEAKEVEVTVTSAELLALNTTPKALIPAVDGKAIYVKDVSVALDYGTSAYATNTDLEIRYDSSSAGDGAGAEVTMASFDAILLATSDNVAVCAGLGQADETNLTIGKGVTAIVATGDPVTGDSPITIKINYEEVSV